MDGLVGAIVGAMVGTFAIGRGARALAGVARRREAVLRDDNFEAGLLDARAAAIGPLPWRLATDADAADLATLDLAHAEDRSLVANGFDRLGELVAVGRVRGVTRAYANAAATTFALVRVVSDRVVYLDLRSYADAGRFVTLRLGHAQLAAAPLVQVVEHPATAAVPHLVIEHGRLVGATELVPLRTIEELLARIAATHDATIAWRAAQPPDELLEADLRAVLRADYARLGPYWLTRLRGRIPAARARER